MEGRRGSTGGTLAAFAQAEGGRGDSPATFLGRTGGRPSPGRRGGHSLPRSRSRQGDAARGDPGRAGGRGGATGGTLTAFAEARGGTGATAPRPSPSGCSEGAGATAGRPVPQKGEDGWLMEGEYGGAVRASTATGIRRPGVVVRPSLRGGRASHAIEGGGGTRDGVVEGRLPRPRSWHGPRQWLRQRWRVDGDRGRSPGRINYF